jgi:hypothetical protein
MVPTARVKREAPPQRRSMAAKVGSLVARLFLTTVATATTGAIVHFIYELCFRPDLYAVGPPLARGAFVIVLSGAFVIVLTSPFILVGLIVLGLPISYLLKRFNLENSASYLAFGSISGIAYGVLLFQLHHTELLVTVASFGAGSALFWWWFKREA